MFHNLFTTDMMTAIDSILDMIHGEGASNGAIQTAGCDALNSLWNTLKLPQSILNQIYSCHCETFGDVCRLILEWRHEQRFEAEQVIESNGVSLQIDLYKLGANIVGNVVDDEAKLECQFDDADIGEVVQLVRSHFGAVKLLLSESGLCSWSIQLPAALDDNQRRLLRS